MTTGRKAWLRYDVDEVVACTIDSKLASSWRAMGVNVVEHVITPTAELDTLGAAGEARGAAVDKVKEIMFRVSACRGEDCEDLDAPTALCTDCQMRLSEALSLCIESNRGGEGHNPSPHTQRQRDETLQEAAATQCEACALGFPTEVAEDGETHWHTGLQYGEPLCEASAILALRRQT